jgi:hypothetical protein
MKFLIMQFLSFLILNTEVLFTTFQKNPQKLWFKVFKAVTMKNAVFWDVMPCGSCKNRRFRGMWCLHDQINKNW